MQKDVIYIDVDDDVTAIIGKIKKAKEKVIALVPPKRAGALQSAVNLRLLDRLAKSDKKHLVLVTNNAALVALAASAKIPVAKNLQSKPELVEVSEQEETVEDDVIDGASIPVGEHAKSVKINDSTRGKSRSEAIDTVDIELNEEEAAEATGEVPVTAGVATTSLRKQKSKGGSKIPNFDSFRKKLFIGIMAAVLLIAGLVWALIFAPAATVVITASTSPSPVSATVKLGGTAATDYKTGVVRSVTQQEKKDVSVDFEATGQKNIGEKATGVVTFEAPLSSTIGTTIPAGTKLTRSGRSFTTNEAVTMTLSNYGGADVGITAVEGGSNFNGISGSASGAPAGINATIQASTSGGTDKQARVVTADDIERAKGQLLGQSTDPEKVALEKLFKDTEKVIGSSFTVERGEAVAVPAVDQEAADGKAKLTVPSTFTMYAIPESDLNNYLRSYLEEQFGEDDNQKIYSTGADNASIANFKKEEDTITVTINGTGRIGPKIDEASIKEQVKGKRYGEVQSSLEAQDGIREVDVQFSYFWVRTVPGDTNKITVTFKVEDE